MFRTFYNGDLQSGFCDHVRNDSCATVMQNVDLPDPDNPPIPIECWSVSLRNIVDVNRMPISELAELANDLGFDETDRKMIDNLIALGIPYLSLDGGRSAAFAMRTPHD